MIKKSFKNDLLATVSAIAIGAFSVSAANVAIAETVPIDDDETRAIESTNTVNFIGEAGNVSGIATIADGLTLSESFTATNAGAGTIQINGGATFENTIGTIGDGGIPIGLVEINSADEDTVTFEAAVSADNIDINSAGTVSFEGAVYADNIDINSAGTVSAEGDLIISEIINFTDDATLVLEEGTSINAPEIIFTKAGTTGIGTIQTKGDDAQTIEGSIGTSTNYLKTLDIKSRDNLSLNDNAYVANIIFDEYATLSIADGKNLTVGKNGIDVTTDGYGLIAFAGDSVFSSSGAVGSSDSIDPFYLGKISVASGKTVTLSGTSFSIADIELAGTGTLDVNAGDIYVSIETGINLAGNGILILANGSDVTAQTSTNSAIGNSTTDQGIVTFEGTSTITGDIGVSQSDGELAKINLNGASKTVTINGNISAENINFGADGTLVIADTFNLNETAETTATITTTANGTGTLTFSGTTTVGSGDGLGDIGTNTIRIKAINAGADDKEVTFSGDVYTDNFNYLGSGTVVLNSAEADQAFKSTEGVIASEDGTGTFQLNLSGLDTIATATTIVSNFGSSSAALASFEIESNDADGDVVNIDGDIYVTAFKITGDNLGLNFADNSDLILGDGLTTDADGNGILSFLGSSSITGNIGTNSARVDQINLDSTDADDTVTFNGDVYTDAFDATGYTGTIAIAAGNIIESTDAITSSSATYQFGIAEGGLSDSVAQIISLDGAVDMTNAKYHIDVSSTSLYIEGGSYYKIISGHDDTVLSKVDSPVTDNSYVLDFAVVSGDDDAIEGSNTDQYVIANRENSYNSASVLSNNRALGSALESIANAGDAGLDSIVGALESLSTASEVGAALDTLNPHISGATTTAVIGASDVALSTVDNRLDQIAGISSTGVATGDAGYQNGMWGEVFGTAADQDDRKGVKGYKADTVGFGIGADTQVSDQTKVGVGFAYANTEADSANGDSDIDSYQLSGYGSYDYNSNWYSDALVAFTQSNLETARNIAVGSISDRAKGDFDSQQYTVKVGGGYRVKLDSGLNVTPLASAKYNYIALDKYTETGSSADLTVDNDDLHQLISDLGFKANYKIDAGSLTYIPELSASWSYDFIGDEQESKNNFTGAASTLFTTKGAKIAQHAFNVGVGLDVLAQDNLTVSFDYDWATKEDYDAHSGAVKARLAF